MSDTCPYTLVGRTALITGAGGLLGGQHASALLEIGSRVVVTDVDETRAADTAARLVKEYPRSQVLARCMDVTVPEGIARVRDELEGNGGVDVLINNAAIDPKVDRDADLGLSRLENMSLDNWNLQLAVGLTGAFLCSQAFGTAMANRGRGVVLNIASDLSVVAPDQRIYQKAGLPEEDQPVKPVTYSVIKTGLIGLTRYLASYWAGRGVRVNALSPGGVYAGQPEAFVQRLVSLIPLGRMAAPDEYRAAVQFLCSDASGYMTGQNIVMDGGRSII